MSPFVFFQIFFEIFKRKPLPRFLETMRFVNIESHLMFFGTMRLTDELKKIIFFEKSFTQFFDFWSFLWRKTFFQFLKLTSNYFWSRTKWFFSMTVGKTDLFFPALFPMKFSIDQSVPRDFNKWFRPGKSVWRVQSSFIGTMRLKPDEFFK